MQPLFFSSIDRQIFSTHYNEHFRESLSYYYGINLPSCVTDCSNKIVCDKNVGSWINAEECEAYGQISHYFLLSTGKENNVYDWVKVCEAISKLSIVRTLKATPWCDTTHDNFFVVNKKKLKSWFKRNHNRFLLSKKLRKQYVAEVRKSNSYSYADYDYNQ